MLMHQMSKRRHRHHLQLAQGCRSLSLRQCKGQAEGFKLSIIIISVFIKEPYTLEKALFECVYGAGRAMEIHLEETEGCGGKVWWWWGGGCNWNWWALETLQNVWPGRFSPLTDETGVQPTPRPKASLFTPNYLRIIVHRVGIKAHVIRLYSIFFCAVRRV